MLAFVWAVWVADTGDGSERRNARRLESAVLAKVCVLCASLVERVLAFVWAIGMADAGRSRE